MTKLLLVVIAVMWIVVLVPPLLRSRADGRPGDSIISFRRQLTTLQRSAPFASSPVRGHVTPIGGTRLDDGRGGTRTATRTMAAAPVASRASLARMETKRRRSQVLVILAGLCMTTAVVAGSLYSAQLWYLHFAFDLLLGLYVFALVQIRKGEEARALRHAVETWSRAA